MLLKFKRFQVVLALAAGFGLPPGATALQLEIAAGPTRLGPLSVQRIEVRHRGATRIELHGVSHTTIGGLGDLAVDCPRQSPRQPAPPCVAGTLVWNGLGRDSLAFGFERSADQLRLSSDSGARVLYRQEDDGAGALDFENLPFAGIPSSVLVAAGISSLSGRLDGQAEVDSGTLRAALAIEEVDFDTPDGRFAGGGVSLAARLEWRFSESAGWLEAEWNGGELLLGPAYLPMQDTPVALRLDGRRAGDSAWRIEHFALSREGAVALNGDARARLGAPLQIDSLDVEIEYAELGELWAQGLNSVAATLGWGALEPVGRLSGSMRIAENALASAALRLSDVAVDDAAGRVEWLGLGARLNWDRAGNALEVGAHWSDARLFQIPLGPSAFEFKSGDGSALALTDPFRLPVLDGALVVERLAWRDWAGPERQLEMDARLEPIDLSALTRALGWTEFGGRLSGSIPGVRVSGSVIEVQGGLDMELFGGSASIDRLSIERPFGALPALAADIEFNSLDLEQVTGAFEFGRMLGLMSGHVRDLRLLDWQPVRFDAWFETLIDSPQRKISQKAVNSISSLSGGGGISLSGTLLRWFDDFPYRRFGLGCALANNVCRMRGLHEADQGGYVILEGRLIPRLTIVGYQRRVDWPRFLAQLKAAVASAE